MRALFLAVLFFIPLAVQAQSASADEGIGARYRVVLVDGTMVSGTLVAATADEIVLESAAGVRTTIPRAQIRSLTPVTGAFYRSDPSDTRLLLFPTARSLPAGAGRFGVYSFIFPTVAVGLNNRLDLSFGSTIPGTVGGLLVNLNAKLTLVQHSALAVAVGGSALVPLAEGSAGALGTFYGVATLGTPETAFTIGGIGGYGTDFDDVSLGSGGAVVLGFEKQLSNHVKFITENYIALAEGGTGALVSAGVRFFGDNLAADVAPIALIGEGDVQVSPIPYFTFSYAFGR